MINKMTIDDIIWSCELSATLKEKLLSIAVIGHKETVSCSNLAI